MRYRVMLSYIVEQSACIEVEAESEEEAIEKADQLAPMQSKEVNRNLKSLEVEKIGEINASSYIRKK